MLNPRVKEIVGKQAEKLGINKKQAMHAYRAYWLWIKDIVESQDFEDIDEEQFNEMRVSINLPGLGKFYTTYKRVEGIKKSEKIKHGRINNKKGKAST